MGNKKILQIFLIVLVGVCISIAGTIYIQKHYFGNTKVEKASIETGPLVSIGEFTVNLQEGSFLKTTITLELADKNSEEPLKEKAALRRM